MRNFADSQRANGMKRFLVQTLPAPEATFVRSDVIFGSPKLDCAGTGICKIMHAKTNALRRQAGHCRIAPALLQSSADGHSISITLERSSVCILAYKTHLRSGFLQLSEACKIDPVLVAALGLKHAHILPGNYAVIEDGQIIRIQVQIG